MFSACPAVQEIAREKAGIFKPGVPAFTVAQPEDALGALREVAQRVGAPLAVVPDWQHFRWGRPGRFAARLGLGVDGGRGGGGRVNRVGVLVTG